MTFRITASVNSLRSGPLNNALLTFHFGNIAGLAPLQLQETAARVIAFVAVSQSVLSEGGTSITGLQAKIEPAGGVVDLPFPTAEYAALRSGNSGHDDGALAMSSYGTTVNLGADESSGRGDSCCMPLKGLTGGRSGQGRMFIPFLGKPAVTNFGLIDATKALRVVHAYEYFFLGVDNRTTPSGTAPASAGSVVYSRKLGTATPISAIKTTIVPSRLRSRTK